MLTWVFAVSTTVVLVSVWGRAVVIDTALLTDASSRLAAAELLVSRAESVMEVAVQSATGADEAVTQSIAKSVIENPLVEEVLVSLVARIVEAGATPAGGLTIVDIGAEMLPLSAPVEAALAGAGFQVERSDIDAAFASIQPLVVRAPDSPPAVGPGSGAARSLHLATFFGLGVMAVSGGALIYGSTERRAMARTLLNRVAVSAFTFTIMLQLGSWVLDPARGRAPVASATETLLSGKLWVPALIAGLAAVVSVAWWLRRPRPEAGSHRRA